MIAHAPSPTTVPEQQPAAFGYIRACAERDGVGNALRAIFDCRLATPALPDDLSRLLDKLA